MNLALYPTWSREAPPESNLETEVRITNELTAAAQWRAGVLALQRLGLTIGSTLGFVDGYDKEDMLRLLDDWLPPEDAVVERWVVRNFVAGGE